MTNGTILEAANDNGPLGRVYTLAEAAAYLRIDKRGVAKVARRHGLCSVHGRDMLFSDSDILSIWDAMRCPSKSLGAKAQTISTFAVLSEEKAFSNLRAHVIERRRTKLGSKQKLAS